MDEDDDKFTELTRVAFAFAETEELLAKSTAPSTIEIASEDIAASENAYKPNIIRQMRLAMAQDFLLSNSL